MKNNFAAEYAARLAFEKQFDAAKAANDKDAMEVARAAYNVLMDRIESKGSAYYRLYSKYADAQMLGNAYIEWDDIIWDKDVENFVETLRKYGIGKFVFTSTWSGAVETAWKLQQNGCKLEGLVEINSNTLRFGSNEHEKKHGYLFSL